MSKIEERDDYLKNPFFTKHEYGDFSPFYITIAICTVILGAIIILNIICCCCSKYAEYWQDRHTGNRWLVSIWSATPHKQPPLDLTELERGYIPVNKQSDPQHFSELQKRESDI